MQTLGRLKASSCFMSSSFSSLCLCASTVDLSRQSTDPATVGRQVSQPKKSPRSESKGLNGHVPGDLRTTFWGFVGQAKRDEGNLLIQQCLLASLLRRTGGGLLNLKDLLAVFPPSCGATSSNLGGPLERGEADLLIPQRLLTKFLRRTGEGLVNLKGLLTEFRPSLKRAFENEPVLEASFLWQNRTKFGHFPTKTCR